jgi:hypothetical protein
MKVLVACEYSGRVRDAFIAKGHVAVSCDVLPTAAPGPHLRGDVTPFLAWTWDLVIAFPPCTHLSCIGAAHWERWQADGTQDRAAEFFMRFVHALKHVPRVAIENPAGAMTKRYRKPDQYVQPWWFGDPWTKQTGLWLKGLPKLVADRPVTPMGPWVGTQRGKVQPDGTRRGPLTPEGSVLAGLKRDGSAERSRARQTTFEGLARAMADQWGGEL